MTLGDPDPPLSRSAARREEWLRTRQSNEIPIMGDVENRLLRAEFELAELTSIHMGLANDAAEAEADWKAHRDRVIVRIANSGDKMAADMREAHARMEIDPKTGMSGEDLYRRYKVTEAAAESSARAMRAIEARLGSFQTLAANLRKVT